MNPIPCAHCAVNFMRTTMDPSAPKLCNSCLLHEERRNPKKGEKMETVDILIRCPRQTQIEIEEFCITMGLTFSEYFLKLHAGSGPTSCEEPWLVEKDGYVDDLKHAYIDDLKSRSKIVEDKKEVPKKKGIKK